MKNLLFRAFGAACLLTFACCKNTPLPEGQTMVSDKSPVVTESSAPLPMGKRDSLAGFKGCDKATWSPLTANSEEFIYQHYTVVVTRKNDNSGEDITVKRDAGRKDFVVPVPEAAHFMGMSRDKLFVDAGTGPDSREFIIFDVDKVLQYYSTPYCGEPTIIQSDRLHYLVPVAESEVTRIPDCPDKEQWEKDGLRVGYGQRCIFNLVIRSLTKKSEWVCVPMQ